MNSTWNLVNFRSGLIRGLQDWGYEVVAIAPADDFVPRLLALGCRHIPLPMDSMGTHPVKELLLLCRYWRILRQEKPDVVLSFTPKPNIYGSLAARLLKIPFINNVAGLGAVFINPSWVTSIVRRLYKLAFSGSSKVFFQNDDDLNLFVNAGLVRNEIVGRVPGSGINLEYFSDCADGDECNSSSTDDTIATAMHRPPSNVRFLLVARMLWDKGIGEYVDAARIVRTHYPDAEFGLLGFLDVKNPAAIDRTQIDQWTSEGVVHYLGASDDIRPFLVQSDCVVLPSYREGLPRTLLEAGAMKRPIITSNAVGCRDVVDDGVNGFICNTRDSFDLAEKMIRFASLSRAEKSLMGLRGREKVEKMFDEKIVINNYLNAIDATLKRKPAYRISA